MRIEYMRTTTEPTHVVRIYLSGPIELAKLLDRTFQHSALIVTPSETTWITTRE